MCAQTIPKIPQIKYRLGRGKIGRKDLTLGREMRQTGRPFPVLHQVPPEGRGPGQAGDCRESRSSDPGHAFFPQEEPKFSSASHVC